MRKIKIWQTLHRSWERAIFSLHVWCSCVSIMPSVVRCSKGSRWPAVCLHGHSWTYLIGLRCFLATHLQIYHSFQINLQQSCDFEGENDFLMEVEGALAAAWMLQTSRLNVCQRVLIKHTVSGNLHIWRIDSHDLKLTKNDLVSVLIFINYLWYLHFTENRGKSCPIG